MTTTPPPPSTTVNRVTELNAPGNARSVGLATVLLAAAVAAAIWLIVGAPDTGGHDPSEIEPVAELGFYGGDAYTGIQNAAAYTEVAVAESGNALAELNADIADDNAEQWKHLYNGLAALLVLVASANLTLALRRT